MADNVIVRVPEQQFIRGEDGYSPEVTIENIDHGHSITITDREHQEEGQTFNVLDGDSAYEQAVAGGYTGTEAQFNEELASFKELSDETKDAAPFYAEYGVTTKAEIETAINGKRQIYVHSALGMDYAPLVGTFIYLPMFGNVPQTGYRFAAIEGTTQYIYDLRDEWSTRENDLAAPAQRAETAAAQALTRMNSADASAQAAATTATTFTEQTVPAAVNTINEAKADALTAVGNAQTTAVGAVQQESTTQQAAIQQKGEETLASIPEDYTELSDDVDDLKSAFEFNSSEYTPPISELLGTPNYPTGWRPGGYNATGGLSTNTHYMRTLYGGTQKITCPKNAVKLYAKAPNGYYISIVEYAPGASTGTRYGVANNTDGNGTNEVEIVPKAGYEYRFYIGFSASGTETNNNLNDPQFMSQIIIKFTTEEYEFVETNETVPTNVTSNFTVLCAKERNYTDGTPTTVDWYLIADTSYQLYITRDFKTIKPIFAANYNILLYKFAVMKNGDIIAVYRSEIESTGSSDAGYRENPFVYLASENWQIQHVVDFGSNLKPSGWLLNCGFCSMPNGDAMFTEYTRPSVETVNCWKISGDITSPASWSVVKSFQQSGSATDGLEHFHYVMYDFYTGIYYISTGDSDEGSQLWYSTDNGAAWTLAWQPSEKYCRSLNLIFTKDYIFWASDSAKSGCHYLFRCSRAQNGVMDFASVVELKNLYIQYVATYGVVYLPRLNALVLMDNCDTAKTSMAFRIYSIDADELYTMTTLESASGNAEQIGFRTEYTEFYPNGNYVLCGFGIRFGLGTYYNLIKGLGNAGNSSLSGYPQNVNNLKLAIYKTATGYGCELRTAFMPD